MKHWNLLLITGLVRCVLLEQGSVGNQKRHSSEQLLMMAVRLATQSSAADAQRMSGLSPYEASQAITHTLLHTRTCTHSSLMRECT